MKITSAEFVRSVFKPEQIPMPGYDEIVFFGRSNVGKSSLINCLAGKKIARTSGTPGKTQCLNYYLMNGAFYFVDAPGYGFAKVPVALKQSWNRMLHQWFTGHSQVRAVVQIVDARLEVQRNDRETFQWLEQYSMPTVVILNKIDKLKNHERSRALKLFGGDAVYKKTTLIPVSAATGEGRQEVLSALSDVLTSRS